MNVNQKTQSSNTCLPEESIYEQPAEGNAKGESVTSTPGAITKGMIAYPNQAGTSSDTPTKLRKRSASSSSPEISYCEKKKAKFEATVFTVLPAIPGTDSARLHIGKIGDVFWVFNNEQCLQEGQTYVFDMENHITLELSHLTSMNFSSKSVKLIYTLLTQAMGQTKNAEDIASFLFHPRINKQLSEKKNQLMVRLLNNLTDLLVNKDSNFKTKLCECISDKVASSNEKSVSKETLDWLKDSLLLEPVLLNLENLNIDLMPITQSVSTGDIDHFSEESINKLLRPEDFFRLFKEACSLKRDDIALRLLLTKNCDRLMAISKSENANALSFFADNNLVVGVEYLISNDLVEINAKDDAGNTPLMTVAKAGYVNCLKMLLGKGARANDVNNKTLATPLHLAVVGGHVECVKLLLNVPDISVNDGDDFGCSPLFYSIAKGKVECFYALLGTTSIQVDNRLNEGEILLHWACTKDSTEFLKALLTDNNVNAQDENGKTPLHWAVAMGKTGCLKMLLDHKNIDSKKKNIYGETPLHVAAVNGNQECLNILLLEAGIDVDIQDVLGMTALLAAIENDSIACLKLLLAKKANADMKNNAGYTPLHVATVMGNIEGVNALLSVPNIDINVKNKNGMTPLTLAVQGGKVECAEALRNADNPPVLRDENTSVLKD